MKNKKNVIITIVIILLGIVTGIVTYNILTDENKLSASEKKWINNNINTVLNVNVVNNVNIFGNVGTGVFYDFINDLELEYKLQINPVTFNYGENVSGLTLGVKTNLNDNDKIFYKDHFVLISKKDEIVTSYDEYDNKKIGVINSDLSYISSFFGDSKGTFVSYKDEAELLEAFKNGGDINYMIVPLSIYLDEILSNNYYIVDHLSDIKLYYTISGSKDNPLYNILVKYFNNWKENLDEYKKRAEFNLFVSALGITDTEVDAMRSVTYEYGLVNNSPYEILMSGNYGGIVAMYLYDFSSFSKIEFNYTKYRNLNAFRKAINKGSIDLYFDYYNIDSNYHTINSKILTKYSVVANASNGLVVNSINSLVNEEVYVQKGSKIYNYLSNIKGIKIQTYNDEKELAKLNKKDVIIVIDENIFNLYAKDRLSNYTERYRGTIEQEYNFKSKNDSAFYKLLTKYAMSLDSKEMIYKGMYSHNLTVKTGSILGTIATYILITLGVFGLLFIIFYKSSKRIRVAKKIKKENKIRFVDQLTSLKNRNYLNEYINNWNNNTIYPQTMIIIDLNNIQFINDTLGYEEGDKQIRSAANILIKTQLDNSDIMRTDGNEFLIYLVGYTQKQVTNYIHKLNKEFKKLPYDYGAEFGYSMITDSIKTIEDAILEATDEMKKGKKKSSEEENEG